MKTSMIAITFATLLVFAGAAQAQPCGPKALNKIQTGLDALSIASDSHFLYSSKDGKCLNSQGVEGYNSLTDEEVLQRENGDCVDFRGRSLGDFGYRTINSFRGANLINVAFPPYGGPKGADLSGADLRGAHDLYAAPWSGRIDSFTKYDKENCTLKGKSIYCG